MNLANKITIFRIFMIPLFLFALLSPSVPSECRSFFSSSIFALASLTDLLDGYIARKFKMISNFGKFADPLADKLLVSAALIALVELGALPSVVVIIIISREFIVTGFRLLAVEKGVVISASIWGKIKTTLQMVMIVFLLLQLQQVSQSLNVAGDLLIWASTVATVFSGFDYIMKNKNVLNG